MSSSFYERFIKTGKKGFSLRGGPFAKWRFPLNKVLYRKRLDAGPEPERPRSAWSNWNYDSELYAFGRRLNEEFNNNLLKQAFVQPSYALAQKKKFEDLGVEFDVSFNNLSLAKEGENVCKCYLEAVLNFWYPNLPKQGVDSIVEYLTETDNMSHVAKNIGVADLIKTEEFPLENRTVQSCLYAIIAALSQTNGAVKAHLFINDFILTQLIGKDINEIWKITNPINLLVEELNKKGLKSQPKTRLLWSTGSMNPTAAFIAGIYVDEQFISKGSGETIEIAEEMAARDALRRIYGTGEEGAPLPYGDKARRYSSFIAKIYTNLYENSK